MSKTILRLSIFLALFMVTTYSFGQSEGEAILKEANSFFEKGDYNQALEYFQKAESACDSNIESGLSMFCNLKIAETTTRLGDAQLGFEMCSAIDTQAIEDSLLLAELYSVRGDALLNLGKNNAALEDLHHAQKLFQSSGDQNEKELSDCYNDLGVAYWNNGNNDLALQYLQNALEVRKELFGVNHPLVADSYNNIGLVNAEINTFSSVVYFNNALKIYQTIFNQNHPKIALTLNNLALQSDEQEDYDRALDYLQQVAAIWEATYEGEHPNKAFTAFSIGNVYYHQGEYEQALKYEDMALKSYRALYGEKHPEIANIYNLEGNIYMTQGMYKSAIGSFQSAIYANLSGQKKVDDYSMPTLENYYNADILLNSLIQKARALQDFHYNKSLKFRDLKAALNTLELADELVSHIRQIRLGEKDKLALSALASEIYESGVILTFQMSEVTVKKKYYREKCFDFVEKSKSSVLLSAIQDTNAKQFSGIPPELLEKEEQIKTAIAYQERLLASNKSKEKEAPIKKDLLRLNNDYNAFVKKLETDYPNYYNLKFNVSHISLTHLQKELSPQTMFITHFVTEDRVFTFYVNDKGLKIFNEQKVDEFDKQVAGLRNAIKYDMKDALVSSTSRIYTQLFPGKLSKKTNQLIIVPEGNLATIPFEVLLAGKKIDGNQAYGQLPFLIKKYRISYDNSATLYVQRKKEIEAYEGQTNDILLVAPISFGAYSYEGLAGKLNNLPGTKDEINEIKYLFKAKEYAAALLTERQATKSNLLNDEVKKYKYIHFATHGVVNESEPKLSRIFLTPGDSENGSLYSGEIYNIDINADLVCLSACETGLGKISKGEGLIGLSRALLYAGAKNLVVSLWTVSDVSTSTLMVDFYNNHLHSSTYNTFSGALRKAKLSLLSDEQYSKPYYWAPFILIGE
jgi:CHAT domain-containing protein/predicted negative regulator of RcsB-dependent stress response